jgi:Fe-S-cluster containining protein
MPENEREAVEARFEDARARKAEAGVADDALTSDKATWRRASRRYFEAQIPCPFLVDEVCSIYPERPIVCASYAVTSPAERCTSWSADLESVPDAIGGSGVLERAVNSLAGTGFGPVALVDALAWARTHGDELSGEHDGEAMFWALCKQIDAAASDENRKS